MAAGDGEGSRSSEPRAHHRERLNEERQCDIDEDHQTTHAADQEQEMEEAFAIVE
jgi:hypothetical protein